MVAHRGGVCLRARRNESHGLSHVSAKNRGEELDLWWRTPGLSGRNRAVDEPKSYSGGNRNLVQQTSEQCSQLIEVVGASDIHVLSDRDFITLIDLCNAEDHDRHILS